MRKNLLLIVTLVVALIVSVGLVRAMDARRANVQTNFGDESLYVNPATARHMALAFNGLAADWYWMRSLQYVGGKIVAFEDSHNGDINFGNLAALDLRLLPSLLRTSTALDPQFIAPYEYGAMILPELNRDEAIAFLNYGVVANPSTWRLYHLLGYVYWQRKDYEKASEIYAKGGRLPGAPAWMAAMGARMKAEGGSHDAAREMYRHLYDASTDPAVKDMVDKQLWRLDSLDERDVIRRLLDAFKNRNGRCVASWREVANELRAAEIEISSSNEPANVPPVRAYYVFKFDINGAPLDPSDTPYELIKNGCDVGLDINTKVPLR